MSSHICPFCGIAFNVNDSTSNDHLYFLRSKLDEKNYIESNEYICFNWYICPTCNKVDLFYRFRANAIDKEGRICTVPPKYSNLNCVPKSILEDYFEACAIVELSPKASATLSRRCLQGMIRDFWNIKNKRNLMEEINAIPQEELTPGGREALHTLRDVGNIGAHPEKTDIILDVEPNEARLMIELVEFFLDSWYVTKYREKVMFDKIKVVSDNKQQIRDAYSNNNISNSKNIAFGGNSTVVDNTK